jgi:hypothetical protein
MSVLGLPTNNALDPTLLPNSEPATGTTYATGTSKYWGTLNTTTAVWTIYGKGIVRNPIVGSASATRLIQANVAVTSSLTQPLNASAWNYIYAWRTGTAGGCDEVLVNSVVLRASLYVEGNLCLSNSSSIAPAVAPPSPAPAVNLTVRGTVTTANSSHIGAAGAGNAITSATIVGGCNGHVPCRWNGGGDPVYATSTSTSISAPLSRPTADFNYYYANASPGPFSPCSTVTGSPPVLENEVVNKLRNTSVGTVTLTPASSYSCKTASGELSWDSASKLLTVKGTIFIDANVVVDNGATNRYQGQATMYINGAFSMANTNQLCGGVVSGNCDFASWNPNTTLLILIVAGTFGGGGDYGVEFRNSAQFQGGVYADHSVHFANSAKQEGPLLAANIDFDNSVQVNPFPLINTVPIGTPGNPNVYAQPGPPTNQTG